MSKPIEQTDAVNIHQADPFERMRQAQQMNRQLGQMMIERRDLDDDRLRRWMVTGKNDQGQAPTPRPMPTGPAKNRAPKRYKVR